MEVLEKESEFCEYLINNSLDGIFAFDNECRYIAWNPEMERILGVSKAEVLGKCAFEIFPYLKETGEDESYYAALKGKSIIVEDRPYKVPETGREGLFEGHYAPLYGKNKEIIGGIGIIRDITEQKRDQDELKYRTEFGKLIVKISIDINKISTRNLNGHIDRVLQEISEFADVDRGYIFLFNEERTKVNNIHWWRREDDRPPVEVIQALTAHDFPWVSEKIRRKELIYIPGVANLPPEAKAEKELLLSLKIGSLVLIPMVDGEEAVGFVAFASVHREKTWSEDVIALLKMVGEIFLNAFKRKWAEEKLQESMMLKSAVLKASPD